jgi:hypothetical protein
MASVHLSWSPIDGADSYQLIVYDRTVAETVTDQTVSGAACDVPIPEERGNHDLVMRVRALCGDRWDDWTEFQPLPLELILGERREPQPQLSASDDPGLLLVFTVDTECSVLRQPNPNPDRVVDELIFGDFGGGGRPAGIGLHMDLLEHFGFRGSFFVDVLMEFEHGQAALERTVEAIVGRGHEVELHVHPEHLLRPHDPRAERLAAELSGGRVWQDRDLFRRLIELSVDLFERRVGRPPVAYRAGGYRSSDIQFAVLEEFGIRIDSSVQPYFNSLVSDWMRTRTQPFRVGGVLEAPPTYLVLDERPGEWETRAFAPNPHLGDPISALRAQAGDPPRVATFVSHSFQLLHRHQSDDPEEVEAFARRLRSSMPSAFADQYLAGPLRAVRSFGEEVDEALVAAVAGILRRVADRADARCVTYGELAAVADRFWPGERHPPTDPVPLFDRNEGVARVSGAQVFSPGLLTHLASRGSNPGRSGGGDGSGWVAGCENCDPAEFHRRLSSHVAEPGEGESLRVRLRTLGVAPPRSRGALPPLAEILFPLAAIDAVAGGVGAEPWRGLPWDGATFRAWLEENGFEILAWRAVPRRPQELAVLEPFAEKLGWLDRAELETEALEVELRPGAAAPGPQPTRVDPAPLPGAARALHDSMHPGEERRLTLAADSSPASRTTRLLALMRAGLEIVGRDDGEYRLLRPIDLGDIRRFAGLAT